MNLTADHSRDPIAATDKQIDAPVCDLYGLTGDETRIVEEVLGAHR